MVVPGPNFDCDDTMSLFGTGLADRGPLIDDLTDLQAQQRPMQRVSDLGLAKIDRFYCDKHTHVREQPPISPPGPPFPTRLMLYNF